MSLRTRYINGEEIFKKYWQEMGDARSLKTLAESLPVNPRTGERITKDAAYKAMWRWACRPENEQKSYDIFRQTGMGATYSSLMWRDELKEKARWVLTKTQYQKWYQK
jgi:hypothetical protein